MSRVHLTPKHSWKGSERVALTRAGVDPHLEAETQFPIRRRQLEIRVSMGKGFAFNTKKDQALTKQRDEINIRGSLNGKEEKP